LAARSGAAGGPACSAVPRILLKLPVETIEAIDRMRDERGEQSRGVVAAFVIRRALEAETT
jgi:metal-responsive CopG/Arc/MetJ family transcriptional regulator